MILIRCPYLSQAALKAANEAQAKKTHVKSYDRKRKNTKEKLRPDLEVVKTVLDLTPEEKACDPGWQLVSVRQRFIRTTAEYVGPRIIRREYFIKVYKKIRVDDSADPVFVQPHVSNAVIP